MSGPTPTSEGTMTTTPSTPETAPAADVTRTPGLTEPSAYEAPMPTARTVHLRTNLPLQAWRFAAVSVRMTRMILRSHG